MFDQGEKKVYVAVCCNRLFVGVTKPSRCRTCSKTPEPVELTSLEEVAEKFSDQQETGT